MYKHTHTHTHTYRERERERESHFFCFCLQLKILWERKGDVAASDEMNDVLAQVRERVCVCERETELSQLVCVEHQGERERQRESEREGEERREARRRCGRFVMK